MNVSTYSEHFTKGAAGPTAGDGAYFFVYW